MIKHKIFKEEKLISVLLDGEIFFDELMQWHIELKYNKDYSPEFTGIVNQRTASLKLLPHDLNKIIEFNKANNLVKGKWAHLIDSPLETALGVKYKKGALQVHEMCIFSSVVVASDYIGFDITPFILEA